MTVETKVALLSDAFDFGIKPVGNDFQSVIEYLENPPLVIHDKAASKSDLEKLRHDLRTYLRSDDTITEAPYPQELLRKVLDLIREGQPVAIPTETVYGLAADARNVEATRRIYQVKGRPSDNPLIVHISSLQMLRALYATTKDNDQTPMKEFETALERYIPLISRYWPGPLTILLPTPPGLPQSHLKTTAFRFPAHPLMRGIIAYSQTPLAAPSANLSGKPSPTLPSHVVSDLSNEIHLILAETSRSDDFCGVESTVIDALSDPPVILRPGSVSLHEIQSVPGFETTVMYECKTANLDPSQFVHGECSTIEDAPRAPGMKYRHYSPVHAKVVLMDGFFDTDLLQRKMEEFIKLSDGGKIGIIRCSSIRPFSSGDDVRETKELFVSRYLSDTGIEVVDYAIPKVVGHKAMAMYLFESLRYMDEVEKVDVLIVEGVDDTSGSGMAVMNRLRKAASHIVIP